MNTCVIACSLLLAAGVAAAQVPPPDIANAAGQIADAPNKARTQAAQAELLRQQTKLLKQQTEMLKQQNVPALQLAATAQENPAHNYTSGNELRDQCGAALEGQAGVSGRSLCWVHQWLSAIGYDVAGHEAAVFAQRCGQ